MAAAGWLSRVRNKCQLADEGLNPQGSHVEVWTQNIEDVTFLTIYENLPYIKVDHFNHETRVWHFKIQDVRVSFQDERNLGDLIVQASERTGRGAERC